MTAREKAAELIVNYQLKCKSLNYDEAKQCALIAVDEMLDFRNGLYMNEGSIVHQYLIDVKQEINKL
jgi:hypothetical protein